MSPSKKEKGIIDRIVDEVMLPRVQRIDSDLSSSDSSDTDDIGSINTISQEQQIQIRSEQRYISQGGMIIYVYKEDPQNKQGDDRGLSAATPSITRLKRMFSTGRDGGSDCKSDISRQLSDGRAIVHIENPILGRGRATNISTPQDSPPDSLSITSRERLASHQGQANEGVRIGGPLRLPAFRDNPAKKAVRPGISRQARVESRHAFVEERFTMSDFEDKDGGEEPQNIKYGSPC
ncbi:hypothetical protein B0O99DRAFT_688422 [Bisporella sp. PMI_857]|nr:hypothetical protein B0O99DRAFT_688422 [Bisporella sp. PMI_857]